MVTFNRIFSLLAVLAVIANCGVSSEAKRKNSNQSHPHAKYVFYFIGDGMGMGHVNAAETYRRDVWQATQPMLMMTFPVASQVRTYSYNSPITDSAAAGTALSTGFKTKNSMVGMNPDSTAVYSISADFMRAGFNVGIATTVAGDDATPAAFYAHAANRGEKEKIGEDAVAASLNFLGAPVFKAQKKNADNVDLWEESMINRGGYTIVRGVEEFEQKSHGADKILMLAKESYGGQAGFTLDSIPDALTLTDLTAACLQQVYTPNSDGFFMMVEAGNIDWAGHANDGGAIIKEILNMQQAIKVAYDFYLQHPRETLIVITADHDTSGLTLGREDSKGVKLNLIDYQRITKDRFADLLKKYQDSNGCPPSWEEMQKLLEEYLGFYTHINISDSERLELKDAYQSTFVTHLAADKKTLYKDYNYFTELAFNILNRQYGIGFTTHSHTGNPVPLYAIGVGSELFTHALDNTEVPMLILKAAGLDK